MLRKISGRSVSYHIQLSRLQFIDVLRGVTLIGMIVYHFSWNISWFGYLLLGQVVEGGLWLLARIVAFSFLFLAYLVMVSAGKHSGCAFS
ncbi:MAG: hypothetical protein JSC189_001194 [Candidatus Tokpelaia sp. JSC189]|nr:MAG: hypothetical protein JSC189_001194 [Candidatus Tokpelaia sp. JSC189]